MRDLNYQLKQLCRRNRDGSFATQRDRERVLDLVANQLQEAGFRHLSATSLKPKHVDGLVARWQAEGLAIGINQELGAQDDGNNRTDRGVSLGQLGLLGLCLKHPEA